MSLDVDIESMPSHVAFIMDGNGRWASRQGLPRIEGHRAGARTAKTVVECCQNLDISVCSLFAFSTENWERPDREVTDIMQLLKESIERERDRLFAENIRLRILGRTSDLPESLADNISRLENETRDNTGMLVQIALSYSGRDDIVRATRRLGQRVQDGDIAPSDISRRLFEQHTETADTPDPDLVIRTAGERRISNFFLWQIAYSELYFTETYWPNFERDDLIDALVDYDARTRTYGQLDNSSA